MRNETVIAPSLNLSKWFGLMGLFTLFGAPLAAIGHIFIEGQSILAKGGYRALMESDPVTFLSLFDEFGIYFITMFFGLIVSFLFREQLPRMTEDSSKSKSTDLSE